MQRKSDDRRYDRSIRSEETRANEFAFRNYYYLIDSFVLDAIVRHNQATNKISRRLEISRFFPLPRPIIIIIIIIPRTIERSPRVAITAASGYLIARVDCYLFSTLCLSLSLCAAWPSRRELSRGSQFFSFFSLGERTSRLRTRARGIGVEGEGKNDVCSDTKITSDSRATSDRLVIGHFGCLVSALFSAIFRFNFPRLV